jgi:hypothetical protein
MTAWVVSRNHISALVEALNMYGLLEDGRDATGQLLWDANIASVRFLARLRHGWGTRAATDTPPIQGELARLPGVQPHEDYVYRDQPCPVPLTPGLMAMACRYYAYQSCEHPGWHESTAHCLIDTLYDAVCDDRDPEELPGYADAPWGID